MPIVPALPEVPSHEQALAAQSQDAWRLTGALVSERRAVPGCYEGSYGELKRSTSGNVSIACSAACAQSFADVFPLGR